MHAVGDRLDRVAGQLLPCLGGGRAVQLRHRVRVGRVAEHEGGHVERRVRVVGVAATELQQLARLGPSGREPVVERAGHQLAVEHLVAGGDRGVDGEHRIAADAAKGLAGRQAGLGGDELAGALDEQERGVPLVEVPHRRVDAERPQGPHAADAEDELLAQPHLASADVQDVGDRAGRRDR